MGGGRECTDDVGMTPHPPPESDSDDVVILDLTDEEGLAVQHFAEYDPEGVRSLLAALNLKPRGEHPPVDTDVFDLSVFRATGDRHLASLFGTAR